MKNRLSKGNANMQSFGLHSFSKKANFAFKLPLLLGSSLLSQTAVSQTAPQHSFVDEYGFDIINFALNSSATKDLSIGTGKQELTYSRNGLVAGYDISSYFVVIDVTDTTGTKMINLGSSSIAVRNGVDTEARGYTYSLSGTNHVLVDPTGRIFTFGHHSGTPDMNDQIVYLTSIKDPDGSVTRINWKQFEYPFWNGETTTYEFFNRIQSVDNNFGYLLKFDYASDLEPYSAPNPADWETLTTITGVNLAIQYCDRMADNCALDAS